MPEPTPPTKWMSEVNKMVECRYPGCGGATKPPNLYCSWMCELDFTGRDAQAVMVALLAKIPTAMEHSTSLWRADERKKLVGRKVYWRGEPAVVEMLEVTLRAETKSGTFRKMPWHDTDEEDSVLHDSVYSESIWWWREDAKR